MTAALVLAAACTDGSSSTSGDTGPATSGATAVPSQGVTDTEVAIGVAERVHADAADPVELPGSVGESHAGTASMFAKTLVVPLRAHDPSPLYAPTFPEFRSPAVDFRGQHRRQRSCCCLLESFKDKTFK